MALRDTLHRLLLASCLLTAACITGGDGAPTEVDEGDLCDLGAAPVTCYSEPRFQGENVMCQSGVRYCTGGSWSACEMRSSEYVGNVMGLITGPTACNPCHPACAISTDAPTNSDLTPENSSGLEYDPGRGGLVLEGNMEGPPALIDSDGDGVPNDADDYPLDPDRDGVTELGGFSHTLAQGDPSVLDPLNIEVQVRTADVYFLMDTTGSMGGEIDNLRSTLSSGSFTAGCPGGVVGSIRCIIPDAWFGVGHADDYPTGTYGSPRSGDIVFRNLLDISESVSETQAAVNRLPLHYGYDYPESQAQALWAVATGNGLGAYLPPRTGCAPDRWGYPCFRPGAIPIVILITDAPYHNGPSGYNYSSFGSGFPVSWAQTVAALNARNMKVITVFSGYSSGRADQDALADATGSTSSSGQRYVFPISSNGSGLGTAIVDAVVDLADYSRIDVSLNPVDNPATAFDETNFVVAVTANGWGPGSCASIVGSTFVQCLPGTDVDFTVDFRNDVVAGGPVAQVFDFTIEILGDSSFVIDTVPVRILVPPAAPLLPPSGTYTRTYNSTDVFSDGTDACPSPPNRPDWGVFAWRGDTPIDSAIRFEFRTADTEAGLATATPVTAMVPALADIDSVNVGDLFDAGPGNFRPFASVQATLFASSDRTESPTLYSFEFSYDCIPME
ncbi:MAG: hypothetical protein ACI9KE_003093 [Polyangiales bacterium]|jgi:hypothetical protein